MQIDSAWSKSAIVMETATPQAVYLVSSLDRWSMASWICVLAGGEKIKRLQIYVIIAVGPRCCWSLFHCTAASKETSASISGSFFPPASAWHYQLPSPCGLVKTKKPQSWWKPDLHWVCMTGKGRTVLTAVCSTGNEERDWSSALQTVGTILLCHNTDFLNCLLYGALISEPWFYLVF